MDFVSLLKFTTISHDNVETSSRSYCKWLNSITHRKWLLSGFNIGTIGLSSGLKASSQALGLPATSIHPPLSPLSLPALPLDAVNGESRKWRYATTQPTNSIERARLKLHEQKNPQRLLGLALECAGSRKTRPGWKRWMGSVLRWDTHSPVAAANSINNLVGVDGTL